MTQQKKDHLGCELGKTHFIGIRMRLKDGSTYLAKPQEPLKSQVEEKFDDEIKESTNLKMKGEDGTTTS